MKKSKAPTKKALKKALPKSQIKNSKTVYIGNLSYERDEEGIKKLFITYGYVGAVMIVKDPKTKKSKGFAFVRMPDGKAALKAIDGLDGKEVDGRTLKVSEAKESRTFQPKLSAAEEEEVVQKVIAEKKIKRPFVKSAKKNNNQGLDVLFNYLKKSKK